MLTLSSGAEREISPALMPAVGWGERTAGGQHNLQNSGGSASSPSHTVSLPTGWQKLAEPMWEYQLCSRGNKKEGDSSGGPLTSPGTAKRNPVRGHGVEFAQPFFPGIGVQSISEKASDYPLLGFPLPHLHFSHQGGLLEQHRSQLVLTALFLPLGPRSHIPRTVGLKYGGRPRACLGVHHCWHRLPEPPRHPPVRKKGVHWCCQHVADEEEGCSLETSASSTSSKSSLASGALDASPSPSLTFLFYFRRTERPSTTHSSSMLNAAGSQRQRLWMRAQRNCPPTMSALMPLAAALPYHPDSPGRGNGAKTERDFCRED